MSAIQASPPKDLTKTQAGTRPDYKTMLADFQYKLAVMKSYSAAFNTLLVGDSTGLSENERVERISDAANAYEDAREQFVAASSKLHDFMIRDIIASRPYIEPTVPD
jgi:hypothetical protein